MASPSIDPSERSDVTATGGEPAEGGTGGAGPRAALDAARSGGRLLRGLLLATFVLLAGLAIAAPTTRSPGEPADRACPVSAAGPAAPGSLGVIVLPPGHPPIPGMLPQGGSPVMTLPPGHPPIDGRFQGLESPARPANPVFQPPATVDL